ncbi:MAG: sodium:proton exchanger [Proteobacteria bacterium]|nr:sodium:proton exchanger [Pseudomonadota bacterium]MDA0992994.1 sodium:proton exchanger [Pseudomonadota bacterium]
MSEPSFVSLIPVFVTLIVALAARNVLVGLFSGVFVGVAMVADTSVLLFVPALVQDHIVPEIANTYNASVLVLLVFIGGFVKLIQFSGGGTAFAQVAARWVSGRARAQLAAWFGGVMIFFSDLGTPLIVGPVFQPLVDQLKVSRQKLAFILDSTSSPVAILIPFIGWGVFIMSVIADSFSANGVATSEWDAFVSAIPYQLYAWLAIAMVPVLTALNFDYGAMAQAEKETANKVQMLPISPIGTHSRAKPVLVWLPLLVLGVTLFATLNHHGFPFAQVAGSDFRAGLSAAYFLAAVVLVILIVYMGVQGLLDTFTRYIEGMTGMMPIAATLVLAWTLGSVSETLGTGTFVADIARDGLPGGLLPAVTFLLAAVISFATGSSWGTIIIMMPLAVPAALATGAALPVAIGAVLSGGLFGDHSSPVSETTILSSTGAGTTPLEHFRTQLPYALTNGVIALIGFVLAGYLHLPWISVFAIGGQIAILWALRNRFAK